MSEDTTFFEKLKTATPAPANDSAFLGISIRAWLAIIIIGTICVNEVLTCFVVLHVRRAEYIPNNQLYMLAASILTFYFAKKTEPAPPPPGTEIKATSTVETKTP